MTDTDSPWKEILEHYFEPFMALFFPEAREMVQEAISSRFGNVPEDIACEIDRFESRDILKVLLRQAIVCSDLTVFRKAIKEAMC